MRCAARRYAAHDLVYPAGRVHENVSEQTTATQPDHFSDGHVITRLSGKHCHPRGSKVQRRESRTDILSDRGQWRRRRSFLARGALSRSRSSSSRHSSRVTLAHRGAGARPAALVGVEFFFLFAATLSCGLWRYSGVMFFLLSAISWPWHATAHVCKHSCAGAGEPRRRAEIWRSAAASSARWIGSRRSPKHRSSAVARAIRLDILLQLLAC